MLGNSVHSEKFWKKPPANRSQPNEQVKVPVNNISTLPLSEQFVIESPDDMSFDDDVMMKGSRDDDALRSSPDEDFDIAMVVEDFKNEQERVLRAALEGQNEKIEQLHHEQLNIKTLLSQLLEKFP